MYSPTPEDWREANRARWDERVPIHAAGSFYDLDAFRAGKDALRDFELAEVGDVTGRTLLHLQCHIGLDTLSWARRGAAHVVGLDFSEPAVETARSLAADLGLTQDRAAFVAADVYDAAEAVPDSSYDVVYTGGGALCWLPDVERWAETAASLVAPGGFLYLAEFHPLTDSLDDETGSRIVHDYFVREPWVDTTPARTPTSTPPPSTTAAWSGCTRSARSSRRSRGRACGSTSCTSTTSRSSPATAPSSGTRTATTASRRTAPASP